jgi:predicted aconitase
MGGLSAGKLPGTPRVGESKSWAENSAVGVACELRDSINEAGGSAIAISTGLIVGSSIKGEGCLP